MSDTNGRRARELLSELGEERDFWDPVEGEMIHDPERMAVAKQALDEAEARGLERAAALLDAGVRYEVTDEDSCGDTGCSCFNMGEGLMARKAAEAIRALKPPTPTTEEG